MSIICQHPAIIYSGLPGDLLLALPTLRAIGAQVGFEIPVVCNEDAEHQRLFKQMGFQHLLGVDYRPRELRDGEVIAIPAEWTFDIDPVLEFLKPHGCDALIQIADSYGAGFHDLTKRLQVPSIGFDSLCSVALTDQETTHRADHYFQLAQAVNREALPVQHYAVFPHRPDCEQIRQMVHLTKNHARVIAMHADTKPNKMWPLTHWAQWLQMLWRDEPDTHVILLGYPALDVAHYAIDPRLLDCRDLPLTVNMELAGLADVFVGIDSCMLHAADLCHVPGVGIFTTTYPAKCFGFRFAEAEHLQGNNPPDDITPEQFHNAYRRLSKRVAPHSKKRAAC